jgi:predicted acetyltransferase
MEILDMEQISLIEPQKMYADEIWKFRQEILECDAENEDQFAGCLSLDVSKPSEEWIKICELRASDRVYEKTIDVDGCKMKRYWMTV